MTSFQISLSPSRRAAGRFIAEVRRALQKALAEEKKKRGITQSDIARAIGVHRSVINREIRGYKDISVGRIAEFAWALGRTPLIDLPEDDEIKGENAHRTSRPQVQSASSIDANWSQQPTVRVSSASEAA